MLQSPTVERKTENPPDPDNEDTLERDQLERLDHVDLREGFIPQPGHETQSLARLQRVRPNLGIPAEP